MIKLYLADISTLCDPIENMKIIADLPPSRRDKILKYKLLNDRKRSLAAGLIINKILSENNIPPCSLYYGCNGKPYADGIFFNVSHSGSYAFGVSSDYEVGCDVEIIDKPHFDIAKRFFTENECNYISNSENKVSAFYKLWTIKESYLKLSGKGLKAPLNSFEIQFDTGRSLIIKDNKTEPCFATHLEFNGHSFAICSIEQPPQEIKFINV